MVLTLYKNDISSPARAVMMVAEVLQLKLHYVDVDFQNKEQLRPEFRKRNPQHTVPTLQDGDFVIWDSHAISSYLVSAYGKDDSLYPKELKTRALIDQRLHFDTDVLFTCLRNAIAPVYYEGADAIAEDKIRNVDSAYEFLELFLEGQKYLAADQLTIADICCVATVSALEFIHQINETRFPKLSRWFKALSEETFYKNKNAEGVNKLKEIIHNKLKSRT